MPTLTTLVIEEANAALHQKRVERTRRGGLKLRRYSVEELRALLHHPGGKVRTLDEIGSLLHITRERVRQLLRSYGVPKPKAQVANAQKCVVCGKTISGRYEKKRGYCPKCWLPHKPTPLTRQMLTVVCASCKRPFQISQHDFNSRIGRMKRAPGLFCSKRCSAPWAATHYGSKVQGETQQATLKAFHAALDDFLGDISTLPNGHEALALASCDRLRELMNKQEEKIP